VAVHVLFRKLDANGEYANGDDDASELESNIINAFISAITPRTGVENVCPMGTDNDAKKKGPASFANVEFFPNEERKHPKEYDETAKAGIENVRCGNFKRVELHDLRWVSGLDDTGVIAQVEYVVCQWSSS